MMMSGEKNILREMICLHYEILNIMKVVETWLLSLTLQCNPGYTSTDMTLYKGRRSIDEGAVTSVMLALLPRGSSQPQGQYMNENQQIEAFLNRERWQWNKSLSKILKVLCQRSYRSFLLLAFFTGTCYPQVQVTCGQRFVTGEYHHPECVVPFS